MRELDDGESALIAERLLEVGGVVAVVLGGSRARGEHHPDSDTDLGIYYRSPLDLGRLRDAAREIGGPDSVVTAPGAWGPRVNGGGWLNVSGAAVDWLYRDLDQVLDSWRAAVAGDHRWHVQPGHPLGVPDFAYIGEVALGRILADPTGEVAALQKEASEYPPRLATALLAGLWEASFLLTGARKGALRGDAVYVSGCIFRAIGLCAHAIHGHAGRWLLNEKGAIASAGRLPGAPTAFAERAHSLLGRPGRQPDELIRTLEDAQQLVDETAALGDADRAGVTRPAAPGTTPPPPGAR